MFFRLFFAICPQIEHFLTVYSVKYRNRVVISRRFLTMLKGVEKVFNIFKHDFGAFEHFLTTSFIVIGIVYFCYFTLKSCFFALSKKAQSQIKYI